MQDAILLFIFIIYTFLVYLAGKETQRVEDANIVFKYSQQIMNKIDIDDKEKAIEHKAVMSVYEKIVN